MSPSPAICRAARSSTSGLNVRPRAYIASRGNLNAKRKEKTLNLRGLPRLGLDAKTQARVERVVARAKATGDLAAKNVFDDGRLAFRGSKVS